MKAWLLLFILVSAISWCMSVPISYSLYNEEINRHHPNPKEVKSLARWFLTSPLWGIFGWAVLLYLAIEESEIISTIKSAFKDMK